MARVLAEEGLEDLCRALSVALVEVDRGLATLQLVHVVMVKDRSIGLLLQGGIFRKVLLR